MATVSTAEASSSTMDEKREDSESPDKNVMIVLEACSSGNFESVRSIVDKNPLAASLQDDATGKSPLMAAAASGHGEICEFLLDKGAPWNAIDRDGQCAGNYATNAEHWEIVNLLVDAGTRAELVLGASIRLQKEMSNNTQSTMMANQEGMDGAGSHPVEHEPCTKPDYLTRGVRFSDDGTALLDDDNDAVMMEWERPLMDAHASILMEAPQKRVLNVGFGMGIIDTALQKLEPSMHIIIEAHPGVYQKMLNEGWDKKPNVRICFGKWQQVVPQLIQEGIVVDGVFYDTYGEHFLDLEDFHAHLPKILSRPNGIYSFFNGLAPDNLFFHGVACQCVKLQLAHLGLDVEFLPCQIQVDNGVWEGVRRKYWHGRDTYYLPRATWNEQFLSEKENDSVSTENRSPQVATVGSSDVSYKRLKTDTSERDATCE